MAMTMKTTGMEDLEKMLRDLGNKADEAAKAGLYDGAGIMADYFGRAVSGIRTAPFKGKRPERLPSPEEKAALEGKTGIAKFRTDVDSVDTLVGVSGAAGYVEIGGKRRAVRLIARAINSGTSFMAKQPVFRKAASQGKTAAKAAIIKRVESELNKITNNG